MQADYLQPSDLWRREAIRNDILSQKESIWTVSGQPHVCVGVECRECVSTYTRSHTTHYF